MGRLAAVLAAGLLAAFAWAQPPPPPPPPPSADEGGFNVWDHLDLELVGLYSAGGVITREAFKLAATWNQSFGRSSLTVAAEFEDKTTSINAELDSNAQFDCERNRSLLDDDSHCDEPTRTLELSSEGSATLSELYFNWVALDNLEVGVGISPIGWGQFLLISPINFMLPQSLGADLGLSRGTLQSPQPHVSVRWAPSDRLEVEAYHFTSVAVDPTIVAVDVAEFNAALPSNLDYEYPLDEAYDYITDKTQTALRLVYRPDWGAVGVTYLDGVSHFSIHRHESAVRTASYIDPSDPSSGFAFSYRACPGPRARSPLYENDRPDCPNNDGDVAFFGELADATYFGLEFAFNLGGGWNLLGEWSRMDTVSAPFSPARISAPVYTKAVYAGRGEPGFDQDVGQDAQDFDPDDPVSNYVDPDNSNINPCEINGSTVSNLYACNRRRLSTRSMVRANGSENPNFLGHARLFDEAACIFNEALISSPGRVAGQSCRQLLVDQNYTGSSRTSPADGSTEFDYSLDILSIGVEKLSTEEVGWSYSLQLLVVAETFGGSFDELLPLYEATGSEYPVGTQIFPGFYAIQNHLFFNRPGQLVIGTGFFASFAGVVGLWNVEVTDNLSMQLGMELVTRISDAQQVEAEGNDYYEIGEGLAPAVNLGFSLAF